MEYGCVARREQRRERVERRVVLREDERTRRFAVGRQANARGARGADDLGLALGAPLDRLVDADAKLLVDGDQVLVEVTDAVDREPQALGLRIHEIERRRRAEPLLERQHTPLGAPPAHALARHLLGDALPLLARRAQVVEAAQERSGRGGQHHHICWR